MGHGIQTFEVSGCTCVRLQKTCETRLHRHGQVLESVTCAKYLGVDISSSLSWNSHIDRIACTANQTLGFVRRNTKTKMSKVRETAYTCNTLVRPQLEYASAVWGPHNKGWISQIKQVQQELLAGQSVISIDGQDLVQLRLFKT